MSTHTEEVLKAVNEEKRIKQMCIFPGEFSPVASDGDTISTTVLGFDITATIYRDYDAGRPEERDQGFWPSLNPKDPGYIGSNDQKKFDEQMIWANKVNKAWENDEWFFVGIVLSVSRTVRMPGKANKVILLDEHAASLWGLECNYPVHADDVDKHPNKYLTTVANELLPEALQEAKRIIKSLALSCDLHIVHRA